MRAFSREDLIQLAGAKSYHRGIDYVSRVGGVTVDGKTVRGVVSGTQSYRVELTAGRRGSEWDCDCPWAEDGDFCKHCVALGLVYLDRVERGTEVPRTPDVRSYLESLDQDELVDLVLAAAETSPELRLRLETRAGMSAVDTDGDAGGTFSRASVDSALRTDGFVEYRQAREYAKAVHEVADELARLLEEGAAEEAEALARYAIEVLDEHAGMVDDSAGDVGGAGDRLVDVHVEACARARPESRDLAEWLLDRQLNGSGMTEPVVGSYTDALGDEGLERYRERLFEGELGKAGGVWSTRFLREEFARAVGDTDLLVGLYASGERVHYVGIVQALDAAGRRGEALEWAEKGLRASEEHVDERLVDYAARAHLEAGRTEALRTLRWEVFERSPEVRTFRALREETPPEGWEAVRGEALGVLRRSAARRQVLGLPCALVDVLLEEADAGAAWEASVEYGCTEPQWLRVAELRANSHPEDALEVYLPRVEAKVQPANTALYPEAAELARKVVGLYQRLGRAQEGEGFVEELRGRHRRKRRFLAELDRVGLRA